MSSPKLEKEWQVGLLRRILATFFILGCVVLLYRIDPRFGVLGIIRAILSGHMIYLLIRNKDVMVEAQQ